MQWTVNLDNATFDFSEDAWVELELTGAELKKFNRQHPRNPDGTFATKGSGSSGSGDSGDSGGDSSSGGGSKSGKSSGPARFKDSNGDGKDDRQLSPAEMRKALAGLPKEMRDALAVYPSVLGAVAMAIANGENPRKHLERLPSNLRDAAERAAKKVADDKESSDGSGQTPKDATKLSEAEVERLTDAGWAGNPSDSAERLYPPGHPKNPKSSGGSRKGMVRAEDGSWVPRSFYDNSERAWSVDLDGAFFDFHGLAWQPDDVIELASGKKSKVSSLIRKLRADPRVDDPERLAGWIKHHRGSGKSSGSNGSSSSSDSDDSSSDSSGSSDSSSPKPEKPKGRMVSGFYIDDDDDPFADPFADDEPDEPKSKEESEQEKYEAKVLRELEREVPDKIYKTIMEFGGLKTRDDLREEYSEIPNTYKRKDGTYGDEMAEMLSMYYPQYGIETERDLIDFLAA